jgi:hypothetical protein
LLRTKTGQKTKRRCSHYRCDMFAHTHTHMARAQVRGGRRSPHRGGPKTLVCKTSLRAPKNLGPQTKAWPKNLTSARRMVWKTTLRASYSQLQKCSTVDCIIEPRTLVENVLCCGGWQGGGVAAITDTGGDEDDGPQPPRCDTVIVGCSVSGVVRIMLLPLFATSRCGGTHTHTLCLLFVLCEVCHFISARALDTHTHTHTHSVSYLGGAGARLIGGAPKLWFGKLRSGPPKTWAHKPSRVRKT